MSTAGRGFAKLNFNLSDSESESDIESDNNDDDSGNDNISSSKKKQISGTGAAEAAAVAAAEDDEEEIEAAVEEDDEEDDDDDEADDNNNNDDDNDDNDDDEEEDDDDVEDNDEEDAEDKNKMVTSIAEKDDDDDNDVDEDDEDDENNNAHLQKINQAMRQNIIAKFHPELSFHNMHEIQRRCEIIRDSQGRINDPFHRTMPFLTKYEKAKIIGERAEQIDAGSVLFLQETLPPHVISGHQIAVMEFEAKRIPFIIRRPMPDGSSEYWRVSDFEIK